MIDGSICYFAAVAAAAVVFIGGVVDGDDDVNDVDNDNAFYIYWQDVVH